MIIDNNSTSLAAVLVQYKTEILEHLKLGRMDWEKLIKTIKAKELNKSAGLKEEQIWTFLIGCGYASCGETGITQLTRILTGADQAIPTENKIWLEFMPLPPRMGEGNTCIDLALGAISGRKPTKGGIQLVDNMEHPWICFCEMKYDSDISGGTTHDKGRNQLLRVIENALCFQNSRGYASKVFVTLVTPYAYKYERVKSLLYKYKYEEYKNDHTKIISDLTKCSFIPRAQTGWRYPTDIDRRIENLSLNWITYEELLIDLPCPEGPLNSAILSKLTASPGK